jgi:hypothetical protein
MLGAIGPPNHWVRTEAKLFRSIPWGSMVASAQTQLRQTDLIRLFEQAQFAGILSIKPLAMPFL